YDEVQKKRIELRYPEAWTLTTPLEGAGVENRFGSLASSYDAEAGTLVANHTLSLRKSNAPASTFSTLLDLTGSHSRLHLPTLVFEGAGLWARRWADYSFAQPRVRSTARCQPATSRSRSSSSMSGSKRASAVQRAATASRSMTSVARP